ncbi:hypothetical protein [Wenyingzhuangia marina]|uniref:DUF4374 domain-containing protein n=1 Tax=Wenyingzhuangia marina TaxID=1195760 RepID=A0A1M5T6H1_9FLAO|nr:hypothetical protein [Wenyingzhuangia marina]GGF65450.1 hypothetical protein GCM10011397_05590 [Wenyingzhuangia marina]SHH45963.1 hypothetical protein SAMN05444281_0705 [Wenyingzhuangia marina]
MKKQLFNLKTLTLALSSLLLVVGCKEDNDIDKEGITTETKDASDRWITVAGAKMGSNPGDGNGGTLVYAVSSKNAKDPNKVIAPFDYGYVVPSNRTARLQASEDGNTLFNITYAGDTGGSFFKYTVDGGQEFNQIGLPVTVAQYVGTAPRWIKLFDGDNTGAAVYVSTEDVINDNGTIDDVTDDVYVKTESKIAVVTISLANQEIIEFKDHTISLDDINAVKGYYISRIDMPVLNAAGDKLYIGAQVRKKDPTTLERDNDYDILGTKTIVLDYPSLDNPSIITSAIGHGNSNGYRSINAFEYNGDVYQANQSDPEGSHILKIGANNQYDNSYDFNLDTALGVTGAYVLAWRPAGNGKAVLAYRHEGSETGVAGAQGFFALVDLNAKTATTINEIPYEADFYLFQYQGFAVKGNEIFVTQAPVGKDGNIYAIDTETGAVTKGAQLKNVEGSHFIGTW